MSLVQVFTKQQEHNGPIMVSLNVRDNGISRDDIEYALRSACRELDIRCGLNVVSEYEYELGFKNTKEYEAAMAIIEPQLSHTAKLFHSRVEDLLRTVEEKWGYENVQSDGNDMASDDWHINPAELISEDEQKIKYSSVPRKHEDRSREPG